MTKNLNDFFDEVVLLKEENARLRQQLARLGHSARDGEGVPPNRRHEPNGADAAMPYREKDFTRLLIDAMAEAVCSVDRQGRITLCNKAFLRMVRAADETKLIGVPLQDFLADPFRADSPLSQATMLGTSSRIDGSKLLRRDGSSVPVDYHVEPLLMGGKIQGAVCILADISERLEAAQHLAATQEWLSMAIRAADIGIWDYEPGLNKLEWDEQLRRMFGLSAGRELTLDLNLKAVHPDDLPHVNEALAKAFDPAGSGDYQVEFRIKRIEDGEERWIDAKGRVMFGPDGPIRFLGAARDISDKKRAEAHMHLMINELNHRVKNSLAMVQGVAAQTFRSTTDVDAAKKAFTERLVALARAHDVLTATHWEGADLGMVIRQAVDSHAGPLPTKSGQTAGPDDNTAGSRFLIDGPAVELSPKGALAMALAIHELTTNAVKYGALSNDEGQVRIRWTTPDKPGGRQLRLDWVETGGPRVSMPQRRGFGSKLIERGLSAELQGEVRIEFNAAGVTCTISAPLPAK